MGLPPEVIGADAGSMHDQRTSTALRQLADLAPEPEPPRWAWAIARVEPTGRIVLPAEARTALGAGAGSRVTMRGICSRVALVLRPDGTGAPMTIDGRGRLRIPAWLRRGESTLLIVGSHTAAPTVLVAPTHVLDGLAHVLAGESR